jgi:hypothetical protein
MNCDVATGILYALYYVSCDFYGPLGPDYVWSGDMRSRALAFSVGAATVCDGVAPARPV